MGKEYVGITFQYPNLQVLVMVDGTIAIALDNNFDCTLTTLF